MSSQKPDGSVITVKQQAYIEVIGDWEDRHGHTHVTELAATLEVSKPSVVQMLGRLARMGMVKRGGREITLTRAGKGIFRELGDRRALLQGFMVKELGMTRKAARSDACRMEHVVSPALIRSLRTYLKESGGYRG